MFLFSRLNRKLIVSYPKHVNSKKIHMIYFSPLTSDSVVYKSFLFLNRVCSIQPVGLRSLTMKAYVCCLDTMHNDLTSPYQLLSSDYLIHCMCFFFSQSSERSLREKGKRKSKASKNTGKELGCL